MHVNPFDIKTVVLAKHARHVVLIHFLLTLFVAAVAFDYVAQWTKHQGSPGKWPMNFGTNPGGNPVSHPDIQL